MINPVTKALNKAARKQYYGFLSERQFPANVNKSGSMDYKRPDTGPAGGAKVPASPKSPKPTLGGKRASDVRR